MKQQKITLTVAKILAQEAQKQIKEASAKQKKAREQKVRQSSEFTELLKVAKQVSILSNKRNSLEHSIEKKHNCNIYVRSGTDATVDINASTYPSIDELKNRMIILNHVDGIDVSKLVASIVKETTG